MLNKDTQVIIITALHFPLLLPPLAGRTIHLHLHTVLTGPTNREVQLDKRWEFD